MIGTFLQMGAALVFVIFLIFAFAFLYKKRQKGSGLINLLAYQSFGQKMGVAALKIGGEILVLGITPTDFKLLKKMDEKDFQMDEVKNIADKVKKLKKIKEEIK